MVLKEYFNFEKNISNKLLSVCSYEIKPNESADVIPTDAFDSFYLLFNVGSILPVQIDGQNLFIPAKDGLLGYGKSPQWLLNSSAYYKFILVRLTDNFAAELLPKISASIDYPFSKIINSDNGFIFSFSLNISVIEMIENIFKMCGENENRHSSFFYLELEANFITMVASILKIILFEEHKFNAVTAAPDLKFYMIMRKKIVEGQELDGLLDKYKLSRDNFVEIYRRYFPKGDLEMPLDNKGQV